MDTRHEITAGRFFVPPASLWACLRACKKSGVRAIGHNHFGLDMSDKPNAFGVQLRRRSSARSHGDMSAAMKEIAAIQAAADGGEPPVSDASLASSITARRLERHGLALWHGLLHV